MSRNQASRADEFGPATTVLELPVPGPSGPLGIEVEVPVFEDLIPLLEALPGAGRLAQSEGGEGDGLEVTKKFLAEYANEVRPLVERYVRSPRISFVGPVDGHVEWRSLHLLNRVALVNGITRVAKEGVADRFATFPALEQAGAGDGTRAGRTVANGNAAAHAAATAAKVETA